MTFAAPNLPKLRNTRIVALLASTMVLAAACTGSGTDVTAADSASDPSTATSGAVPTTESSTPETTPLAPETSPTPPDSLPGELIEFGPAEGAELAVVGVAYDDTLNIRVAPGTEFAVIGELGADEVSVIATGHNRLLPDSFWVEIDRGGELGWVNERFLGYLGVTIPLEPNVPPSDEATPLELAQQVAGASASTDPPSVITVAVEPEGNTVVMDVLGLGDDAAKGYRLTITTGAGAGGLTVTAVDQQIICSRGMTADKLCV